MLNYHREKLEEARIFAGQRDYGRALALAFTVDVTSTIAV